MAFGQSDNQPNLDAYIEKHGDTVGVAHGRAVYDIRDYYFEDGTALTFRKAISAGGDDIHDGPGPGWKLIKHSNPGRK